MEAAQSGEAISDIHNYLDTFNKEIQTGDQGPTSELIDHHHQSHCNHYNHLNLHSHCCYHNHVHSWSVVSYLSVDLTNSMSNL